MTMSKTYANDICRDEVSFPVRYVLAACNFELKNHKESLKLLYKMMADADKALNRKGNELEQDPTDPF